MNNSAWLEVMIPAHEDEQDDMLALLVSQGFEGFLLEEDIIKIYISPDDKSSLKKLRGIFPGVASNKRLESEWEESWKQYYKPTPIGKRLLIQPAWLDVDNPDGRAVYLNNPGMSFGTGLHASTRLCLEIMEGLGLSGKKVLDIGCGSGILGICAMLLGAESVTLIDSDPYAVRTALENAELNSVSVNAIIEDILGDSNIQDSLVEYDIIFSNLIADIIIPLASVLSPAIRQNKAIWVASGIINTRLDDVLTAASDYSLAVRETKLSEDWAAIIFDGENNQFA